ncbi:MAG: Na(+)-translocating NADH-quinone reductase subunit C [Gammaproteobacteria bacterium]|nr:Na(+)-translocating NADH-quinone reductase subunit C [Gammaproteobacteria bacterium]
MSASDKDSIQNIIKVAFAVCLVCSVIVSVAAVSLKPIQKANKQVEIKKNILAAAGLLKADKSIDEQFEVITTRMVDMRTGNFSTDLDIATYNQRKASKDPKQSEKLGRDKDIASIKRLENYSKIYVVESNGKLQTLILPVRGYGLWSTMRGFVALESDLNTIVGLGFYEHAETPGLGGEIDNPKWKKMWVGKKLFDNTGVMKAAVKKGPVDSSISVENEHMVDGLSGATLTSNGVTNLIRFWMGKDGFAPFLNKLKAGEA